MGASCLRLGLGISVQLAIFARRIEGDAQSALVALMGVLSVAAAALAEHAEWTLMHRERPLEHSRI